MSENGPPLPIGTVTFLFTDIEGSTRLLQALGDEYKDCLETHAALMRRAISDHDGVEISTEGDSFFVVFRSAPEAAAAATAAQRSLHDHAWPRQHEVMVRMGVHTGEGVLGGDSYVGLDVHRAARIASAAHGGQVLMSQAAASLAGSALPEGVVLKDMGDHRLKDLADAEHLHQLVISGLPADFPPIRSLNAIPNNLPIQLTSFVGRDREVSEAVRLLSENRLLTLTGPGGTGKTRLSLQAAAEVAENYQDGVFFVPLASISDPDLVPTAVLEALGLHTTASGVQPRDHLFAYLQGKSLLLLLDNMEQLLDAAPFVSDLLGASPDSKFIVTSRAPLRIRGEQEMPVPPLEVPDVTHLVSADAVASFEGVELFAVRAMAIRPDFEITGENAAAVAKLTARLDGLPLAIELAASRIKLLTPQAILERLDNRLLANQSRDLPARQQTLINAIGWSYDLLREPCRHLFERLSVFIGGSMLREIEEVCGPSEEIGTDILDGLAELVDHSLVRQSEVAAEPRFRMLTVIREFAQGALVARDEDEELRRRHAHAYLLLAEEAEPLLLSHRQREWLDRLAADHDNLRAAADWAVSEGDAATALRLAAALWRFWQIRGHLAEGRERLDTALSLEGDHPRLRARALEALGGIAYWSGDEETLREAYAESLDLMREHGEPADIANALYNLSFTVSPEAVTDEAHALLEESLAISQGIGDRHGVGRAFWGMGNQHFYRNQYESTIEQSLRAAAEFEQLDAPFDLGWAWFMAGDAYRELRELEQATDYFSRALPLFAEARDLSAIILFLHEFAGLAAMRGDRLRAARLSGAAQALRATTGVNLVEVQFNAIEELVELLGEATDEVRAAFEEGMRMSLEETLSYVSQT